MVRKKRLSRTIRRCSKCGRKMVFHGLCDNTHIAHLMNEEDMCYECAYWTDLLSHPTKSLEIIGGSVYNVFPVADKNDKSVILGGKGKTRYFMRPDRTVFRSNDIWKLGTPPAMFVNGLRNTAVEITEKAFNKLTTERRLCKARGCFDRYKCWRYNLELEKDSAPYNKVPAGWKTGDEHCRSFIGFDDILGKWEITNKHKEYEK